LLRSRCKARHIAATGTKAELCDRLLASHSEDFEVTDWNRMEVEVLRQYLQARGLPDAGTKEELVSRLHNGPSPRLEVVASAQELKCMLRKLLLSTAGSKQDLSDRLLNARSLSYGDADWSSMRIQDLQEHVRARGLAVDGTRSELIDRLKRNPPRLKFAATAAQLRAELRMHGAPEEGTKRELEKRLEAIRIGLDKHPLSKKSAAKLREMCRDLSLEASGTKESLCKRLLAARSLGFTEADWEMLSGSELKEHAQARGLSRAGTRAKLIGRLVESEPPALKLVATNAELKAELRRYQLQTDGCREDLLERVKALRLKQASLERAAGRLQEQELLKALAKKSAHARKPG